MAHHRVRIGTEGIVFHVVNRGVRRLKLFDTSSDYDACLMTLAEACERIPLPLLAYCLMPNHFHLVVRPSADGQLSQFMQWFTATHSKRWHGFRGTTGTGSVYQGRFKSIAVQSDRHFLTLCRYVEQNPLRANLVRRAEEWQWSSYSQRCRNCNDLPLATWPVLPPPDWGEVVNTLDGVSDIEQIRRSIRRGSPFGDVSWVERMARALDVQPAVADRGRPKKWRNDLGGLFSQ
jgi:putative transposase